MYGTRTRQIVPAGAPLFQAQRLPSDDPRLWGLCDVVTALRTAMGEAYDVDLEQACLEALHRIPTPYQRRP
jgi:hypothetical protein